MADHRQAATKASLSPIIENLQFPKEQPVKKKEAHIRVCAHIEEKQRARRAPLYALHTRNASPFSLDRQRRGNDRVELCAKVERGFSLLLLAAARPPSRVMAIEGDEISIFLISFLAERVALNEIALPKPRIYGFKPRVDLARASYRACVCVLSIQGLCVGAYAVA